jgi:hypothetical protein
MFPSEPISYFFFALVASALALYFKLLIDLKTTSEIKLMTFLETPKKKPAKKSKQAVKQKSLLPKNLEPEPVVAKKWECPHYVGYLTSLPKGSSFPAECFGCRKVIQCLRVEPTKVIESFYLGSPETSEIET